jgi:ubiquinone/menaquinone biosynthesis C-methylase UbiE
VPSEEEVDALVGVEFHELSYNLDGEDLRVGELGGGLMATDRLDAVQQLLACPVCKGELTFFPDLISCLSCARHFPQRSNEYFDLLPSHLLEVNEKRWKDRQQEMEAWYEDLMANPARAGNCFAHDYTPYAALIAELSVEVLDVGGGVGIVREYLPDSTGYTVVDPSLDWIDAGWASLAGRFSSLQTIPRFVRGIGEYLPFRAQVFDAALALWSLNHVRDPGQVFGEVHRVLRSGGQFVVVLEDMPPSWGDIAEGTFAASMVAPGGGDPSMENPAHPSGGEWPIQSDHLRIHESEIEAWISHRFDVARREWIGQYLTLVFRKIDPLQDNESTKNADTQLDHTALHVLRQERHMFVRRLQVYEHQLKMANSTSIKVCRTIRRLKKRIQTLAQDLLYAQESRTRQSLKRLGRIRTAIFRK